jgi:hypothetical protein
MSGGSAHNQTMADNYFPTMQKVKQRLQVGEGTVVKVQNSQLEVAKLEAEERSEAAVWFRKAARQA